MDAYPAAHAVHPAHLGAADRRGAERPPDHAARHARRRVLRVVRGDRRVHVTNPTTVALGADAAEVPGSTCGCRARSCTDSSPGVGLRRAAWTVAAPGPSADPDAVAVPGRLGTITVTSAVRRHGRRPRRRGSRQASRTASTVAAELPLPSQPAIPGRRPPGPALSGRPLPSSGGGPDPRSTVPSERARHVHRRWFTVAAGGTLAGLPGHEPVPLRK